MMGVNSVKDEYLHGNQYVNQLMQITRRPCGTCRRAEWRLWVARQRSERAA